MLLCEDPFDTFVSLAMTEDTPSKAAITPSTPADTPTNMPMGQWSTMAAAVSVTAASANSLSAGDQTSDLFQDFIRDQLALMEHDPTAMSATVDGPEMTAAGGFHGMLTTPELIDAKQLARLSSSPMLAQPTTMGVGCHSMSSFGARKYGAARPTITIDSQAAAVGAFSSMGANDWMTQLLTPTTPTADASIQPTQLMLPMHDPRIPTGVNPHQPYGGYPHDAQRAMEGYYQLPRPLELSPYALSRSHDSPFHDPTEPHDCKCRSTSPPLLMTHSLPRSNGSLPPLPGQHVLVPVQVPSQAASAASGVSKASKATKTYRLTNSSTGTGTAKNSGQGSKSQKSTSNSGGSRLRTRRINRSAEYDCCSVADHVTSSNINSNDDEEVVRELLLLREGMLRQEAISGNNRREPLPDEEAIRKMTSKQRRQLRNRISARNFRLRRKEYIASLEKDIKRANASLNDCRKQVSAAQQENQSLVEELAAVRRQLDLALTTTTSMSIVPVKHTLAEPFSPLTTGSPVMLSAPMSPTPSIASSYGFDSRGIPATAYNQCVDYSPTADMLLDGDSENAAPLQPKSEKATDTFDARVCLSSQDNSQRPPLQHIGNSTDNRMSISVPSQHHRQL